ncbi:MAG: hypothetical protein AB1689_17855 [Thermodesulfobacteriota bacterium]
MSGTSGGELLSPTGPLFAGPPGAHGFSWLEALPILVAAVAAALLVLRLVKRNLPTGVAAAALLLPIAAYGLGSLFLLEESKQVSFCGSCHIMTPIVASLQANDGSLASMHYTRGLVPHDEACYTCHSGYGIWGTMDAKRAGIMHMVRTVTGDYKFPLKTRGPFDIDSCLGCHSQVPSFRAVVAHQDPDLQKQLVDREIGCTGICHPAAHPESALTGTKVAAR